MIKQREYFSKETEFNKAHIMTKKIMKILIILRNIGFLKKHMKKVK